MAAITETIDAARPVAGLRTVPWGIMQSPVTPMTEDLAVDYATYEKLLDFNIGQGVPGTTAIMVSLHIGESLNLTDEERRRLAETAVKVADGRVPVVVNVSMPGTDAAVDLARHAERVGADGVIAISPYYWKPPQEAIYEHFAAIMEAVDIAVMAYNSPTYQDGIGLSPQTLVRLIERFDNFIGLKEASHNFETFIELRRAARARPDFAMMLGIEYLEPAMAMGGRGSLSAFGGVAPNLVTGLYNAIVEGRIDDVQALQETCAHLWQLFKVGYPAPIKAAFAMMGRPVGPTRLPIRPLDAAACERLRGELAPLGIFDTEPHGW